MLLYLPPLFHSLTRTFLNPQTRIRPIKGRDARSKAWKGLASSPLRVEEEEEEEEEVVVVVGVRAVLRNMEENDRAFEGCFGVILMGGCSLPTPPRSLQSSDLAHPSLCAPPSTSVNRNPTS